MSEFDTQLAALTAANGSLQTAIGKMNNLMTASETTDVTIGGQTKPSIAKQVKTRVYPSVASLDAATAALNNLMTASDTSNVTIDGISQPSVAKQVKTRTDPPVAAMTQATSDFNTLMTASDSTDVTVNGTVQPSYKKYLKLNCKGDQGVTPVLSVSFSWALAVSTGSKNITVPSNHGFGLGQPVRIWHNASNYMTGLVSSRSATSVTVLVDYVVGTGTYSDWSMSLSPDNSSPPTTSVFVDDVGYVIKAGSGALENHVVTTGVLKTGNGTIAIGDDALNLSTNATYSNFIGHNAGKNAGELYCVDGYGLRALQALADGQYVQGFGTDVGLNMVYGRNSILAGAKCGLHKTDVQNSTLYGTSAGYGYGTIANCTIIGGGAADGQVSPSAVIDLKNNTIIGEYCGRQLSGQYNTLIGANVMSLYASSAWFVTAIGRSAAASKSSGSIGVYIGDSAGSATTGGNSQLCIGYNSQVGNNNQTTVIGNNASTAYPDSVAIGESAVAQAQFQFRLGTANTVVSVQNPIVVTSDKRDKVHVGDLTDDKAAAIVLGANVIEYRRDYRQSYRHPLLPPLPARDDYDTEEAHELAVAAVLASHTAACAELDAQREARAKIGTRIHSGVYAQDEYDRLAELGIDFTGIQHFAYSGGEDQWAVSYEQYIPALLKIIQRLDKELKELRTLVEGAA